MLAKIRSVFANSWVARIAAVLFAVAFGAWGIQGALTGGDAGEGETVATVGGRGVTVVEFDNSYQRQLSATAAQMARSQGGTPDPTALPPEMKREIGAGVLRQLVTERSIVARASALGLVVPDHVLRDAVFAIPAFQGTDGQFDRNRFNQVLQASHLTEKGVLALVSDELMSRALLEPVRASAVAPAPMVDAIYNFIAETVSLAYVDVPFDSIPAPPEPTPATLQRFYTNHPGAFSAPEYRKIRAVVLSRQTVARDVPVPEADIKAAYAAQEQRLFKPARRSVQVVTVPNKAKAAGIADLWRGGAQWASVQALATADGGTAVSLANAGEREFPSAALGHAVFAADEGVITDPVPDGAGFVVLRVIGSTAATGDYASEHDRLREQLAEKRAAAAVQDRVDRLQDAIAGGGLDKIPADTGAVTAEGTLDAQGMTPAGDPAPLPGSDTLRQALIAHAFQIQKGAPPSLQTAPDGGYYAVEVESVTPPRKLGLSDALPEVIKQWHDEAVRHAAETRAAAIYAQAEADHSLNQAAAKAGLNVITTPPFSRTAPPAGVPAPLARVAFGLPQGHATMVRSDSGYSVGIVTAIGHPPSSTDANRFAQLQNQVQASVANDLETTYANYVLSKAKTTLNEAAVNRVLGQ
jgi:peptidyl-prolyl cis-trans isomerase D